MEKIILTFCALLPALLFAGQRSDIFYKRNIRELVSQTRTMRASEAFDSKIKAHNERVRIISSYPNAWFRMSKIEPFSHFGFKLQDVRDGNLDFEEFLSEYENYIETFEKQGVKK